MTEIWKPIPGSNGYQVSDQGRVASPKKILTPFVVRSTGYMQVNLDGRKRRFVHRLVAQAFCSGCGVVNHRNGIKTDNRASNLEWVTASENNMHAYRSLGIIPASRGKYGSKHPTSKAVVATCIQTGVSTIYGSGAEATYDKGFCSAGISRCCKGKIQSHKGHKFRYATKNDVDSVAFGAEHGVTFTEAG